MPHFSSTSNRHCVRERREPRSPRAPADVVCGGTPFLAGNMTNFVIATHIKERWRGGFLSSSASMNYRTIGDLVWLPPVGAFAHSFRLLSLVLLVTTSKYDQETAISAPARWNHYLQWVLQCVW